MRVWVWLVLLVAPISWALEFGQPVVVSSKNDPLEVRIPVTGLGSIDASQLFPMLAPESAFSDKGIELTEGLTRLLYAVERQGTSNQLVIRSLKPWPEPELTTLVEVFTPQGAKLVPLSITLFEVPPAVSKQQPTVEVASTAVAEIPVAEPPVAPVVKRATLRVGNGATLWRLARRVKPESASMEQVILALYQQNPEAFEFGNVNALEKGRVLEVPTLAQMLAMPASEAKQVFDAHMREPKRDFRLPQPVVEAVTPQSAQPALSAATAPVAQAVVASVDPGAVEPAEVPQEATVEQNPQTANVDALLEKISILENKLDQVDAKLEVLTTQRATSSATLEEPANTQVPTSLPEASAAPPVPQQSAVPNVNEASANVPSAGSTGVDWHNVWAQIRAELPTEAQWNQFWRTELGQGTAIFLVVLVLVALMRKVYGGGEATPSAEQPTIQPVFDDALQQFEPDQSITDVQRPLGDAMVEAAAPEVAELAEPVRAETGDALESAIARLKSKIEDPTRLTEAEALYQEGDDSLIDAFSADALNENPEWGQDPDDEADVANHQLELAQNYLDMGMTQTAIELLERVVVSPHQPSAQKARALLDARGR